MNKKQNTPYKGSKKQFKIKRMLIKILGIISIVFLISCQKEAGLGGKSTLTGKIMANYYDNSFTNIQSTEPAMNENVYVVFDNNPGYGTKVRTAFDGTYQITNLQKGKYTIYCYSKDPNTPSGDSPVIEKVEITKNKEVVTVNDIYINL